jgi:hypothetical protein
LKHCENVSTQTLDPDLAALEELYGSPRMVPKLFGGTGKKEKKKKKKKTKI